MCENKNKNTIQKGKNVQRSIQQLAGKEGSSLPKNNQFTRKETENQVPTLFPTNITTVEGRILKEILNSTCSHSGKV